MDNKPRAIMLMLLSTLSFSFMSAFVKLAGDLPVYEKVLFRNVVSVIVAYIVIKKQGIPLFGKRKNQKYLLLRSGFGVAGMILNFYAISNLTLADSSILGRLGPFFVMIFAAIFLKEQLKQRHILALIGVSFGAVLVIKPEFDMTIVPAMAGIGGAIVAAAAYTVVRFLKDKEHPSTIVFYFSLVAAIVMFVLTIPVFVMPTPEQWVYLILTGICAVLAQYALTYAFKYAPASELSIFNHTNIIFSTIIGIFLFGEIPDVLTLIGGAIIIGIAYMIYRQDKKELDLQKAVTS